MKNFTDILMTTSEVMAFLRISRNTIYRMLTRKDLTSFFLPNGYRRFLRQDIYDFIDYDSGLIKGQLRGQLNGDRMDTGGGEVKILPTLAVLPFSAVLGWIILNLLKTIGWMPFIYFSGLVITIMLFIWGMGELKNDR